jgi:hypothetical protein
MNGTKYSGSWNTGSREGFGAFQDCVGTYQGPWKGDKVFKAKSLMLIFVA